MFEIQCLLYWKMVGLKVVLMKFPQDNLSFTPSADNLGNINLHLSLSFFLRHSWFKWNLLMKLFVIWKYKLCFLYEYNMDMNVIRHFIIGFPGKTFFYKFYPHGNLWDKMVQLFRTNAFKANTFILNVLPPFTAIYSQSIVNTSNFFTNFY